MFASVEMDKWAKAKQQLLSFFTGKDSRHTGNVNGFALRSGAFGAMIGSFLR